MSAADLIRAGQTGVADVIRALAPVSAVKTGDQSAPNTTLADDGELAIAVLANKKYLIIQYVNYEGAHSPGDLKIGFSAPAGAVLSYGLLILMIPIVAFLAIRVYSAGVLLYGQRPGARQIVGAILTPPA